LWAKRIVIEKGVKREKDWEKIKSAGYENAFNWAFSLLWRM